VVVVIFLTYVLYGRWKNRNLPHCEPGDEPDGP
jgi:hypothetical protein